MTTSKDTKQKNDLVRSFIRGCCIFLEFSVFSCLYIFSSYLYIFRCKPIAKTKEDKESVADLERKIIKRKAQLHELEQALPRQSGFYLRIILGDVNVSILNRQDKVRYKDEYEKFKLILNVIGLSMAFINLLVNYR